MRLKEETMITLNWKGKCIATSFALLVGACGGGGGDSISSGSTTSVANYVVPKATCGTGDHPETALQGQVPAAMRSNFSGFNCNLEAVGQVQGEGGSWSAATYKDAAGHICAYHATMAPIDATGVSRGRANPGVPVIDITDPTKPVRVTSLTSPAMLDPWESLRVSEKRGLLVADNGANGAGGSQVDIYDIASDCRSPQLLASMNVGTGTDGGVVAATAPSGHEGGMSPDGLTYYIGSPTLLAYYAVDISVPAHPKLVSMLDVSKLPLGGLAHGLSVSDNGNRAYFASIGGPGSVPVPLADPNAKVQNGFYVIDTTDVQARKPSAQMKLISSVPVRDGSVAQHTIPISIKGKPYVVHVDEGGAGGIGQTAAAAIAANQAACNAGLSPFPMAHIFDFADEANPKQVSELRLETHVPANCSKVLPDLAGLSIFTYGSHYCSVDNRQNATAMACSYFNSGIRVFDIRDPAAPKEIAYLNPPGTKTNGGGSGHLAFAQWHAGSPDWCSSRLDFDFDNHRLVTACQDNGVLVMNFKNGVWPFPESTRALDEGN
jgi:hypothetical protein